MRGQSYEEEPDVEPVMSVHFDVEDIPGEGPMRKGAMEAMISEVLQHVGIAGASWAPNLLEMGEVPAWDVVEDIVNAAGWDTWNSDTRFAIYEHVASPLRGSGDCRFGPDDMCVVHGSELFDVDTHPWRCWFVEEKAIAALPERSFTVQHSTMEEAQIIARTKDEALRKAELDLSVGGDAFQPVDHDLEVIDPIDEAIKAHPSAYAEGVELAANAVVEHIKKGAKREGDTERT